MMSEVARGLGIGLCFLGISISNSSPEARGMELRFEEFLKSVDRIGRDIKIGYNKTNQWGRLGFSDNSALVSYKFRVDNSHFRKFYC